MQSYAGLDLHEYLGEGLFTHSSYNLFQEQ